MEVTKPAEALLPDVPLHPGGDFVLSPEVETCDPADFC